MVTAAAHSLFSHHYPPQRSGGLCCILHSNHFYHKYGVLSGCHPHLLEVKVTLAAPAGPALLVDFINGPELEVIDAATDEVS